jgi:amino-acid N-acetyltransferase
LLRKAKIKDAKDIQTLVNYYARQGQLLPRSLNELYESIRDFYVYEDNLEIIGVCALHINWEDLAEIRSLAVKEERNGEGVGMRLARVCLDEAKSLDIPSVFALTYRPGFFEKLGFQKVDKTLLPQKVWQDCLKCIKFPECDEEAVMIQL